eukprot:scaffold476815_cov55-Attheya_sp.AAC.1
MFEELQLQSRIEDNKAMALMRKQGVISHFDQIGPCIGGAKLMALELIVDRLNMMSFATQH